MRHADREALVRAALKAAADKFPLQCAFLPKMPDDWIAAIAEGVDCLNDPTKAQLELDNIRMHDEREGWQEEIERLRARVAELEAKLDECRKLRKSMIEGLGKAQHEPR